MVVITPKRNTKGTEEQIRTNTFPIFSKRAGWNARQQHHQHHHYRLLVRGLTTSSTHFPSSYYFYYFYYYSPLKRAPPSSSMSYNDGIRDRCHPSRRCANHIIVLYMIQKDFTYIYALIEKIGIQLYMDFNLAFVSFFFIPSRGPHHITYYDTL